MWYLRAKIAVLLGILSWVFFSQYVSADAAFGWALLFTMCIVMPILANVKSS